MISADTVLGVLLAGGLSRRMGGGDKGLLPLAGKPLMAHALDRLSSMTSSTIINANGDPGRFSTFAKPVVPDTISGFAGPLAGVLAGMKFAADQKLGTTHVLTAAADTPFFPDDLLERFNSVLEDENTIVLATSLGNRHPVFGLWPVSLAHDLESWLEDENNRKVLAWVKRHNWNTADFPSKKIGEEDIDPYFNINTPEDLEKASTLMKEPV